MRSGRNALKAFGKRVNQQQHVVANSNQKSPIMTVAVPALSAIAPQNVVMTEVRQELLQRIHASPTEKTLLDTITQRVMDKHFDDIFETASQAFDEVAQPTYVDLVPRQQHVQMRNVLQRKTFQLENAQSAAQEISPTFVNSPIKSSIWVVILDKFKSICSSIFKLFSSTPTTPVPASPQVPIEKQAFLGKAVKFAVFVAICTASVFALKGIIGSEVLIRTLGKIMPSFVQW